MRAHLLALGVGCLLLAAGPGAAQTPEIQKKIMQQRDEIRKERASLDELMALAVRNNGDIRVAESKVRQAEAEFYRTRTAVLNKIAVLQQEIRARAAAADEAAARYQRDVQLAKNANAISAAEVSASRSAMTKFMADLAVAQAELDGLVGKHAEKAGEADRLFKMGVLPMGVHLVPPGAKGGLMLPSGPASTVPAPLAEKLRKALNAPVKPGDIGQVSAADVIKLLRDATKGANVLGPTKDSGVNPLLHLPESIPVGAFYQWAEDQFGWRFVVRDYGIVAMDRNDITLGAVLLLEFWRMGEPPATPK
jgi:hypothetical protein